MTKIKICGLSRLADVACVNKLQPDYVGFVFAKSRRQITKEHAITLRMSMGPQIQTVGVFVNELPQIVGQFAEDGIIDLVQLHGQEDETYLHNLRYHTGAEIIQAFSIKSAADIQRANKSSADYVLVDSGVGGTGQQFDWSLLEGMERPYFLAGGLNAGNVEKAIAAVHPFAVDISSGVETEGIKDPVKIEECIRRIKDVRE
ncbi:MAG: phosphoribosylanthranilate isomerase [Lachnospiraceae bacterium]|nr:phosphoribosylanthranilate isomerase [Lachnospiraceae bacterium]